MKRLLLLLAIIGFHSSVRAQYQTNQTRTWDQYPPEIQKTGFGLHDARLVQMDDESALEEVLLFSAHNGHYPYFDLFKNYFVIIDYYSKEVKFTSNVTVSTKRDLQLEDRNQDKKFEIYRRYFHNGEFSVDEFGNKLSVTWAYDRIEWNPENKTMEKKSTKQPSTTDKKHAL